MVFLKKLIEKKSGWVISQYSLVQEPLKQPDVVPWLESDFLTIILISECLMIVSILDLKKKKRKASFVNFVSLPKIFSSYFLNFLSSSCLFSGLEKELAAFQASAARILPHVRPSHLFLMFLQQAPPPLKSVN